MTRAAIAALIMTASLATTHAAEPDIGDLCDPFILGAPFQSVTACHDGRGEVYRVHVYPTYGRASDGSRIVVGREDTPQAAARESSP